MLIPTPPSAQITLSFSRDTSIVAIAHGEQYPWAQTALETSGFQRHDSGTYVLSADDPDTARATVTDLVRAAERHRTIVGTSSRRFLGDIAQDLAAHLPGRWTAELNVYSHPVWQEDLVPWLWDSGELSQAVQTGRVPYAARLCDGADISLLLIERPGHDHGYVIGAFAPEPFDDNYEEPHAPRSAILPADSALAAGIVTSQFLPAYHRALDARRLNTITAALNLIHEERQALQAVRESGRYTDGVRLDARLLPELERAFTERAWLEFHDVLTHAPALLEKCRPDGARPQDAAAPAQRPGQRQAGV